MGSCHDPEKGLIAYSTFFLRASRVLDVGLFTRWRVMTAPLRAKNVYWRAAEQLEFMGINLFGTTSWHPSKRAFGVELEMVARKSHWGDFVDKTLLAGGMDEHAVGSVGAYRVQWAFRKRTAARISVPGMPCQNHGSCGFGGYCAAVEGCGAGICPFKKVCRYAVTK